jgi:hypothetical protein
MNGRTVVANCFSRLGGAFCGTALAAQASAAREVSDESRANVAVGRWSIKLVDLNLDKECVWNAVFYLLVTRRFGRVNFEVATQHHIHSDVCLAGRTFHPAR